MRWDVENGGKCGGALEEIENIRRGVGCGSEVQERRGEINVRRKYINSIVLYVKGEL